MDEGLCASSFPAWFWFSAPASFRLGRQAEDRDARIFRRLEKQGIAKVKVEGDDAPVLAPAGLDYGFIRRRAESFVCDSCDIVAVLAKEFLRLPAQILIQLQPHRVVSIGISTYLSRAISAP